jgi:hypothetical protein
MLVLAAILHKMLPESRPTINLTYPPKKGLCLIPFLNKAIVMESGKSLGKNMWIVRLCAAVAIHVRGHFHTYIACRSAHDFHHADGHLPEYQHSGRQHHLALSRLHCSRTWETG